MTGTIIHSTKIFSDLNLNNYTLFILIFGQYYNNNYNEKLVIIN